MIDFTSATADEKEQLLGREFREIDVLSVAFSGPATITKIFYCGEILTLVGDPSAALLTHLAGAASPAVPMPAHLRKQPQGAH